MIAVPALSALVLLAMATLTGITWLTALLVILLGAFGLSANAVLIHLAVTYAGRAQTLGSALVVAAFYSRTPMGTPLAGASLGSALGLSGPATVGTIIVILTLIPTIAFAVLSGRVPAAAQRPPLEIPRASPLRPSPWPIRRASGPEGLQMRPPGALLPLTR
ncbi:Major facilitator family transporter [Kocuria palustris PEL]|uniref:Major facilitator family transporter n=1 Tax=Kocuria palustris PEL TaxID=1236550 RepID=M2WDS9_9MICC|nr:Major facilitator family transporter [Kocuria palustris PEL]